MKKRKYDILFWILVVLCLMLHFLFAPLGIIKDKELTGYYKLPEAVPLTPENYFSHHFQDSSEVSLNYGMGMFPAFTRIHHQLEYSWFNRLHVKDVHIGRENYLFRYCKTCITDNDFDPETLQRFVTKYKQFADSLKKTGKQVLWIIAPEKNIVCSEYLPDDVHSKYIYRYYWTLKETLRKKQVAFIDFNELAYREREKFPFRVFNKGGVHWTNAYASRCYDSLCRYLSLAGPEIKNVIQTREMEHPWEPDIDMEAASNMLIPLQQGTFYYTDMTFQSGLKNKKLLLIGDSFSYSWLWTNWLGQCFDPASEFWYYNREVNSLGNKFLRTVDKKEAKERAKNFDYYLFLFSAGNAENLDYGFIDSVYP